MAHNIYHVARQLPPGSCAVAVVGAAHVRGIERLFGEHAAAAQSGSPGGCSPEQMLALQERADVRPLLRLVCGTLIGARCAETFNYPYFPRFFSIFSRFPLDFWLCSLDSWRPDAENGRKMGENG